MLGKRHARNPRDLGRFLGSVSLGVILLGTLILSSAGYASNVDGASAATIVSSQHAPVVTYRDGQLTIDAENSTLAAVLELVAQKTGAVIDIPPGSGTERIVGQTGPGRAADVLALLLNGAPFDFVIVSSPQPPHDPTQVLLFPHKADTPAGPAPQPTVDQPSVALVLPKPPEEGPPQAAVLGVQFDNENMEPSKEPMSPDVLEKKMKDRAQQLREYLQQQQPPQ